MLGDFRKESLGNEQGVGDRVVDEARDHAHSLAVCQGRRHVGQNICQRAFFWFDCNISKRIEKKYLADEGGLWAGIPAAKLSPRCGVPAERSSYSTVAQRRSGMFDTPRL
jgi:hypothetical protein